MKQMMEQQYQYMLVEDWHGNHDEQIAALDHHALQPSSEEALQADYHLLLRYFLRECMCLHTQLLEVWLALECQLQDTVIKQKNVSNNN